MRNHALKICALVLLAGCKPPPLGDQTITSVQDNSAPTGFVSGRVLDAANGQAVSGAVITALADGPVTATTDAAGLYRLGPLPAGSYTVFFEGPGFVKRFADAIIGSASSQFPVGNTVVTLDIDLSRPNATASGQVLTNTGRVATGATLYLDLRSSGSDLVATTQADANGKFTFSGLPGAAFGQPVTILVAPYDENTDGVPDYGAISRTFSLFPGFTTYNTLTLFALGVQLVTSNVSDADLLPNEALTLTFSGKLKPNQSTVTLFRNAGGVQVGATLTWDADDTTATLTPVGGNLVEGQSYYVLYNVKAVNGAATTNSISFVVRPPAGAPPLGTVAAFRVTVPLTFDSSLNSVTLAWSALANAGGYRIYGKDTATASAYLLLSSLASGLSTTATVNLSLFDSISGDTFTTPLGHHNHVRLAIVATDRVGNETPFATAATIELSDGVAPTIFSAQQTVGSANNQVGGAPATVQYQVFFSELMSTDVLPQVVLPNASTSAVWAWTAANRGTFTITVPPGIDGRGTLSVTAGVDTSSNAQAASFDASLQ